MQVTPQSHPKREEGVLECLSAILIGCWLRAALESDAPQLPHVGQAGTALRTEAVQRWVRGRYVLRGAGQGTDGTCRSPCLCQKILPLEVSGLIASNALSYWDALTRSDNVI